MIRALFSMLRYFARFSKGKGTTGGSTFHFSDQKRGDQRLILQDGWTLLHLRTYLSHRKDGSHVGFFVGTPQAAHRVSQPSHSCGTDCCASPRRPTRRTSIRPPASPKAAITQHRAKSHKNRARSHKKSNVILTRQPAFQMSTEWLHCSNCMRISGAL